MRLPCPACDAEYDVPDALIGNGRRLRCARCAHDWLVQPPVEREAAVEAGPSDPAPLPRPAVAPPEPARQPTTPGFGGVWLAWIASVAAVVLGLVGLWLFRAALADAWPPLQRLYAVLD